MHTLNHITADVRNIATSGSNPIDFRISTNQMEYWAHQFRATFISQAIQKRQDINDAWVQSITCLDLIEVDKSECCEIVTNCKILRTELTIPRTIETNNKNGIVRVVKPNGDSIPQVTPSEARYTYASKYGSLGAKWYLKNDYVYIIDDDVLESISVYGLFDNPTDLASYTNCGGSTCYDRNGRYPVTLKMAEQIVDAILKKKVYPFLQIPQDTTNNANNDPNTQINPRQLK
jgi:hypothetical protein